MNNLWKWTKRIMSGFLILIFVLTAVTYLAGAFAKRQLARSNLIPGKLTNVGAFNMHIYCTGEGSPTVLLEAGLNDFFVSWSKVQPEVARVTHVCSYDRAGLGWSDTSPQPRTSEVMVQELHTLLQNTGIEGPYVLVGHSFGGINMRLFAKQYPDEVAGMVLVDSAHEQQIERLPFLKDSVDAFISQFRTLSMLSSSGLMALSPAIIPNRGFPQEAYKQYQAVLATTSYFDGAIAESTMFYSRESLLGIPQLGDLPLIVLSHGLSDTSSGVEDVRQNQFEQEWTKMQTELAALSSRGKQLIAEKSEHYIQLDQPELVIASILELVQENR
jgi:pimeloyl-ACP methyl ester carboxylesterase